MIVTLCGSGRFRDEIFEIAAGLTKAGHLVLCPPLHEIDRLTDGSDERELLDLVWKGATYAHLQRVVKADVVVVVNPTGYVGSSTTLELGFALGAGKMLVATNADDEPARQVLYDRVLGTDGPGDAVSELTAVIEQMEGHVGGG